MKKIKSIDCLDCENITMVMNSKLVSQEEKNYFINMVCRYYYIDNVELENGNEIETMERTNLYFEIQRLVVRSILELSSNENKYIIFNRADNSYINYDNEIMENEDLIETFNDVQFFRTKEKAIETINELKLNDDIIPVIKKDLMDSNATEEQINGTIEMNTFQPIQATELTILNGQSVYDWLEPLK